MAKSGRNTSKQMSPLIKTWCVLFSLTWSTTSVYCQFDTPPVMHFERNWTIPSNAVVGSIISTVHGNENADDQLTYFLEPLTTGIHIPFRIDNTSGIVFLNESIKHRGGEKFMLYVCASNGGSIPSKYEVYVHILNASAPKPSNNNRPKLPSFLSISQYNPPREIANNPPPRLIAPIFQPKENVHASRESDTPRLTHLLPVPVVYKEEKRLVPEDARENPDETKVPPEGNVPEDKPVKSAPDVTATIVPIASVCAVFLAVGMVALLFRKKLCTGRSKENKEDMRKESSDNVAVRESPSLALQQWRGPRAYSNRYESWDAEQPHSQAPSENAPPFKANDKWEFPRHKLKFFNILGEGAFGQVWKCEAVDIDGFPGRSPVHGKTGFRFAPRHVGCFCRRSSFQKIAAALKKFFWNEGGRKPRDAMQTGSPFYHGLDYVSRNEGVHVVAVKTLKENATEKERSDLISELQVMKMLEPHPNVVKLLGCCTDKDPIFLIMEYVSKGKLQSYLRNSRAERYYNNMHGQSKSLTSRDLTSFVYQVARGMEYLSSNGIIHRDLAARNILISENHICKVADFGFARDVIASYIYERKSEGRLPIRWMAPESLYDNVFSVKSDVWSFGVLIWEIVTLGSTPYPGLSAAEVMRRVRDGHRLDKPEHCRRELYNIMYYCWDKDPKQRPSFTECVQLLEKLLTSETDYIELERFPDHSYYNMMNISGEKL